MDWRALGGKGRLTDFKNGPISQIDSAYRPTKTGTREAPGRNIMFGRFLKPRWQHANPDMRLKAVEQLSPSGDEATLARLARGDSNSLVRAAASGRITDFSLLDEIHQRDEEPSVREAASLRIMALLAGTAEGAPNSETRLRLIRLANGRF